MKQEFGPSEGAAEEDEGPVRREEYRGDAGSGQRGVDAQEAMDETDEEDSPQQKEPACGLKSQRRQCSGRPVRPSAGVDVDQQGPVCVRDHHRRHRSGRRRPERAPLIVGERERMVRHRIGHHPAPGDLAHDSHIRDADAAQEQEEQQDRRQDPSCGGE